jgi:hypothetical protein
LMMGNPSGRLILTFCCLLSITGWIASTPHAASQVLHRFAIGDGLPASNRFMSSNELIRRCMRSVERVQWRTPNAAWGVVFRQQGIHHIQAGNILASGERRS